MHTYYARGDFLKKIFLSAFMGILALILVNFTSFLTGVSLSINILSIAISSILGMYGVITMLVLGYII
ncbi:MAG: pro-sigmaK processing inhibitor BofA family protein [Clostridia bacterium]